MWEMMSFVLDIILASTTTTINTTTIATTNITINLSTVYISAFPTFTT